MRPGHFRTVIQLVRDATAHGVETADSVLLHRFINNRDDAAFATIVKRHGPMVLGVCRRLLHDANDVDDAFQAAFIVLACKARSIARPELLGTWIYRVAHRIALRARAGAARRRERPMRPMDVPVEIAIPDADWADLRPVLDEEIDRLPERYRLPVVLCYLQGLTNDEAARRLGCVKGTIGSRLAWARERLRTRLVRRGITLSAGSLASLFAADVLSAAVPMQMAVSMPATALSLLSGSAMPGAAATAGAALAKGALRAMLLTRIRMVLLVLVVLGSVGIGAGFLAKQPAADAQAQSPPVGVIAAGGEKAKEAQPPPAGDDAPSGKQLKELLQKRRAFAQRTFELRWQKVSEGAWLADETFFAVALRLHDAELELSQSRTERIKACDTHLSRMKAAVELIRAQLAAGKINEVESSVAEFFVIDAEIRLERAKAK